MSRTLHRQTVAQVTGGFDTRRPRHAPPRRASCSSSQIGVDASCSQRQEQQVSSRAPGACDDAAPGPAHIHASKRSVVLLLSAALPALSLLAAGPSNAIGFTKELKRRKIPIEEYSISDVDGLRIYELAEGNGKLVAKGDVVTVHFDCKFKGLDVVSTRAARLLSGNRTIAEPFQFVAGGTVDARRAMKVDKDEGNGLFSGQGGPQPPPALSTAVIGMKKGGKRSVIVPPEIGYGDAGVMEIPPGATFELQIELLDVA